MDFNNFCIGIFPYSYCSWINTNCFTKNIPKERFYELRKKAFEFVDNYNRKAKFRRGIASLRNLGVRATLKRVYRHFYSKFLKLTIAKSN